MALPDFTIHSLGVGGGVLAISPIPGRSRHYQADWDRLLAWNPACVISLTTTAELQRKGAGSLGQDLANAGISWMHLPIADMGVPDRFDWPDLRDRVCGLLQNKGRVLVHCYGGCGRSGMLALRLMIAAGEAPDMALERLRGARPCAIETDEQMAWARQDATA
ncbi:protein-tyrosine phosphatase family protein [Yoonia sp. SS1-5]|uniref:protein-tyrosine-phosphatase n=1 Tax=Yoonia rhodophyticola TaxID=3137370 RepID=A0AAN0MD39_9RHOB